MRTKPAILLLIACAGCATVTDGAGPQPGVVDASGAVAKSPEELWALRPSRKAVLESARLMLERADTAGDVGRARTGFAAASRAYGWLVEHEPDRGARLEHAGRLMQAARQCSTRIGPDAVCDYWLAVGLGFDARERRARGITTLGGVIDTLERLSRERPDIERGGPHRVLARILLNAPRRPLGPGSPARALEHAKSAVEVDGDYPPNLLIAAAAAARAGDPAFAREMSLRARAAASLLALEGDPDAAEWIEEAERALSASPDV